MNVPPTTLALVLTAAIRGTERRTHAVQEVCIDLAIRLDRYEVRHGGAPHWFDLVVDTYRPVLDADRCFPTGVQRRAIARLRRQSDLGAVDDERPGLARSDGSDTQRGAAKRVTKLTGRYRPIVLAAIGDHGPATDEWMQDTLRMDPNTQRPRRVELVDAGWVRDSGQRHATASDGTATAWEITEAGSVELERYRRAQFDERRPGRA